MPLDNTLIAAAITAVATIAAAWITTRARRHGARPEERRSEIWLPEPRRPPPRPPPRGRWRRAARSISSAGHAVDAGLWKVLDRLPLLKRRTKPWMAALLGFFFGGIGVALYLRRSVDVLIGIVLLVPLSIAGSQLDGTQQRTGDSLPTWLWIFEGIAALYCFMRSFSSNRRLDAEGRNAG